MTEASSKIGPFQLDLMIGKGAFSTVYEAQLLSSWLPQSTISMMQSDSQVSSPQDSQSSSNNIDSEDDNSRNPNSHHQSESHSRKNSLTMEKSLRIELLKSTINPPLTVAIKCISKSTLHQTPVLIGLLRTEVELLQSLNHESIVKMYGIVENVETIGIVMEKIMGIELLNYLQQNDKIADMESRAIFKQLLLAIQYLHSHGVCHRDLKLENILINTTTQKIKIIDFGLALNTPLDGSSQRPPYLTKHRCGSEEYASPELILGGPYDARYVDIWACGVIFFALLVGYLPFSPPTPPSSPSRKQKQKNNLDSVSSRKKRTQMYHRICRGEYTLPPELSTESENLLKGLLEPVIDRRWTIEQALKELK